MALRTMLLAALLLVAADAGAASRPVVVDRIDYASAESHLAIRYHLEADYDAGRVRVRREGSRLHVVLPGARLRGRVRWPAAGDRLVTGSIARTKGSQVLHRLRIRRGMRVEADDVTVGRAGNMVLVHLPRPGVGPVPVAADTQAAPARPESVRSSGEAPAAAPGAEAEAASSAPAAAPASVVAAEEEEEDDASRSAHDDLVRDLLTLAKSPEPSGSEREPVVGQAPTPSPLASVKPSSTAPAGAGVPRVGGAEDNATTLPTLKGNVVPFRSLFWIAVVTVLAAVALVLFRRQSARLPAGDGGIVVLDRKSVVGKNGVALLQTAGRLILVGTGEGGLRTLADLGAAPEPPKVDDAEAPAPRRFARLLASAFTKPSATPCTAPAVDETRLEAAAAPAPPRPQPSQAAAEALRKKFEAMRDA